MWLMAQAQVKQSFLITDYEAKQRAICSIRRIIDYSRPVRVTIEIDTELEAIKIENDNEQLDKEIKELGF